MICGAVLLYLTPAVRMLVPQQQRMGMTGEEFKRPCPRHRSTESAFDAAGERRDPLGHRAATHDLARCTRRAEQAAPAASSREVSPGELRPGAAERYDAPSTLTGVWRE